MLLADVNVLIYAFREDAPEHKAYREWLDVSVAEDLAYGTSDVVLSSFLRIVTHPRIFKTPTPLAEGIAFVEAYRGQPNAVAVSSGARHWSIFVDLCRRVGAKGPLVADAYLAALAIESGSEWVTADRDFSRFPGLRWRHPLTGS